MNSILGWLDETARKMPHKTAIIDEQGSIDYAEYRRRSLSIAAKILEIRGMHGSCPKQPVVVYLEKSKEILVSFMGTAYSGGFYSPIDVEMPVSRINKILETLKPQIVITTGKLKADFEKLNFSGDYILLEQLVPSSEDEKVVCAVSDRIIDTDLLYVLFTSGSTGMPKGVSITHRSVEDYINWVTDTFSLSSDDCLGNQSPFYFDNSVLDIYSCIKTGATLDIIPRKLFFQPVPLLEYIKSQGINTLFWVPSALIVVAKLKAFRNVDLSSQLKRVLFAGEVMPNKWLNVWRKYIPNAVYANLYGPTEITVDCTCYIVDREFKDDEQLPIGMPIRNTDVLVLDGNHNRIREDEVDKIGELCVRGTSLAMGYYNNPEKTAESFVQNPLNPYVPEIIYKTGDLVRYNERGELVYVSRKDFQIKHLGHRIELGEIETAVSSIEGISMCCCLYDDKRQKIVLFIDADYGIDFMKEHLGQLVPDYMIPGRVVCLKDMPINANGKIDRVKLREML